MNIEVKWTGKYPCLCFGEWILTIDGEDKSNLIPENLRRNEMETYQNKVTGATKSKVIGRSW